MSTLNSPEKLPDSMKASPENILDAGVEAAVTKADGLERKFANIQGDLRAYVDTLLREETPEEAVRHETRSALASLEHDIKSQEA